MTIKRSTLIFSVFSIVFLLGMFTGSDLPIFSYEAEMIMMVSLMMVFEGLTWHKIFHKRQNTYLILLFVIQIIFLVFDYKFVSIYPDKTRIFLIRHIFLLPLLMFSIDKKFLAKLLKLVEIYILSVIYVYLLLWPFQGNNGSFLNNYQYVATYSSILVVLLFAKFYAYPKIKKTDIFNLLLSLLTLMMTGKRSFVLIVTIIFILGILFFKSKNKSNKLVKICLITVIGLLMIIIIKPDLLQSLIRLSELDTDTSLSGRTRLWDLAGYLWSLHKNLGIGYGTFSTFITDNLTFVYNNFGIQRTFAAHNIYIQLMAEVGIVGTIIFAIFFIFMLLKCIKTIKHIPINNSFDRYIIILSTFLQIWFLIYGLSGNPLYMAGQYGLYLFTITMVQSITNHV